jgi:hypothetical protein
VIAPVYTYSDAHHSIALCGNVVLTYSSDMPNPSYLEAWTQATDRLMARGTERIAVVTVIDSRARPPNDDSKKLIRSTIERHKDHIEAFAYVVEGRGFGAAAMRSALSLINLAARYPFRQKVFSNIEEGAQWLCANIKDPQTGGANTLIGVVQTMRGNVRLAAAG